MYHTTCRFVALIKARNKGLLGYFYSLGQDPELMASSQDSHARTKFDQVILASYYCRVI